MCSYHKCTKKNKRVIDALYYDPTGIQYSMNFVFLICKLRRHTRVFSEDKLNLCCSITRKRRYFTYAKRWPDSDIEEYIEVDARGSRAMCLYDCMVI